jgi:L-ascorbate metabolism protein UlaG (beta-lactamase superfamily)
MMRTLWQETRYGALMLVGRPSFALGAAITIILYVGAAAAHFIVNGAGVAAAYREAQEALGISYLANEGFLITGGNRSVLIDALFREGVKGYATVSQANREKLENAGGPFDKIDLALATHFHADHFDALAVSNHLIRNPRALFVSTNQAVEKLKASHKQFDSFESRAVAAFPKEGERVRLTHNGVGLQALNITHGRNRPVENLGFIIEVAGWKLLHIGDSEATADDFRLNGLKREAIDIAFLPFWYFLHDAGRKAVRDEIQPRHIVLMHIPPPDANDEYINRRGGWAKALGEIKADFPNAVWFEREMERKEFR